MAERAWRLEWIEREADWAALAPRWRALGDAAAAPFFLDYDWLDCWWRVWAPPDRLQLRVAVIRRGDALLAAWPLVLRSERRQGVATRLLWSMGRPISDYWDMLLDPAEDAGSFAAAFAAALRARSGEWELLELSEMRADGPFMRHVAPRLGAAFALTITDASSCARLAITADWPAYFTTQLSAQRRRKIRKEWRLLEAQGPVELRCGPVAEDELTALIDELAAVEAAHPQQGPARPGAFSEARLGAFLRRLLPLVARRGALRLGLLRCGGEAAAYTLWFSDRGWHGGYATAYRRRHGPVGIGKLLLLAMLEHLWAGHPGETIDFLRGDQEYKQLFAASGSVNRRLWLSHSGWRSRFAGWREERLRPWLARHCRRLGRALDEADRGGWGTLLNGWRRP